MIERECCSRLLMDQHAYSSPANVGNFAVSLQTALPADSGSTIGPTAQTGAISRSGLVIINADDWGRDQENTERTLECISRGAVSSVSAMVFMADSERAAAIARERKIDAGLHLNFTTPFSAKHQSRRLADHQREIAECLLRHRLAQALFHPRHIRAFEYVVLTQLDEFRRIYGAAPERIDGHHHMHLCLNVLLGGLLPSGIIVRRNFSFQPGEKSWSNRIYRHALDHMLARTHRLTDYFFALQPIDSPEHMRRIFSQANQSVVEVETHPIHPAEYKFLAEGDVFRYAGDHLIATRFAWGSNGNSSR
jgi:predicted glycoside hydrolase/deacetylase ChbG (UPF0249 family)